MFSVIYDNSAFSGTLAMVDKNDMDLKSAPMLWSLFSFKVEMVGAPFPICNIVLVFGEVLYIFVRYLIKVTLGVSGVIGKFYHRKFHHR